MFFSLGTATLIAVLIVIVGGATVLGVLLGIRIRAQPDRNHEPVGVVQGVLLSLVGLLLAFGLTMAIGRYESRRALVVQEANDIGTTYLRAELLSEPARTTSLDLLRTYTDTAIDLATLVPGTKRFNVTSASLEALQNRLWTAAGLAVRADPAGTAPRLYIESLNDMIDVHSERVASLGNRVPNAVMLLQVLAAAVAGCVLALYLTVLGRSVTSSTIVAVVLAVILFVSFDLDRPQRGFITVPHTALIQSRQAMSGPPAAAP